MDRRDLEPAGRAVAEFFRVPGRLPRANAAGGGGGDQPYNRGYRKNKMRLKKLN